VHVFECVEHTDSTIPTILWHAIFTQHCGLEVGPMSLPAERAHSFQPVHRALYEVTWMTDYLGFPLVSHLPRYQNAAVPIPENAPLKEEAGVSL
jgi:hypothetical protein